MRAIGTEMITFGVGLPVLYFAVADVALNGLTPAEPSSSVGCRSS